MGKQSAIHANGPSGSVTSPEVHQLVSLWRRKLTARRQEICRELSHVTGHDARARGSGRGPSLVGRPPPATEPLKLVALRPFTGRRASRALPAASSRTPPPRPRG